MIIEEEIGLLKEKVRLLEKIKELQEDIQGMNPTPIPYISVPYPYTPWPPYPIYTIPTEPWVSPYPQTGDPLPNPSWTTCRS